MKRNCRQIILKLRKLVVLNVPLAENEALRFVLPVEALFIYLLRTEICMNVQSLAKRFPVKELQDYFRWNLE